MKQWQMKAFVVLAALVLVSGVASATALNYDPNLPAPAPVLDAGWNYDQVNDVGIPSVDSPYVYNLAAPATFTITDDFIAGDVYTVFDFGNPILTTVFGLTPAPFGGDPLGWGNPDWSKGWILLGAGAHSLEVQGDGAGGLPAGFYGRLDSANPVPEPGTFALLGLGLGGVALLRRRRRA